MGDVGRAAAATSLIVVLLMQAAAAPALTLPASDGAHRLASAPRHVERATERSELPDPTDPRAPARERPHCAPAPGVASTGAVPSPQRLPAPRARSHPASRTGRNQDLAPH